MGGSSSKSDSESEAGFQQEVWGPQSNALSGLYKNLGGLWDTMSGGMTDRVPGGADWMQGIAEQSNPYWEQQMQGGAYADMGLQDQLMGSLNESMNAPSNLSQQYASIMGGEGNTYADAMRDQYTQDATRAQESMLQNLDARAAASGMSGGSRHGTATAQGMQDINQNLQSNMANLGYETFDKDLQNKLNIAGMADSNRLAQQQMMANMIGGQQQAMQGGVAGAQGQQGLGMGQFAPYMMPWDMASSYGNIIGPPTVLGSGNQSADSSSKGVSGGVGGGK